MARYLRATGWRDADVPGFIRGSDESTPAADEPIGARTRVTSLVPMSLA